MEDWLGAAALWIAYLFYHAGVWLPLVLSVIATGISILAYRRGSPPVKPKAWASFKGRGPNGFTIVLNVENHTEATMRLNHVKAPPYKLGINGREIRDGRMEWESPIRYEFDWVEDMPLNVEVTPGSTFSTDVRFSSSEAKDSIRASLILSISTTRRTIKSRTIVVPIIIPPAI